VEPIEALLDEVRLLWHVMAKTAARLHKRDGVTVGMRALLELLQRQGPATVPQMARARGVTRQHVQGLVDLLAARRLVRLTDNPAHRRSALVELTPAGERLIGRLLARERKVYARLPPAASAQALGRALATLRTVRQSLGAAP
jgi:DNA-binding MarR family transcriptional regulator